MKSISLLFVCIISLSTACFAQVADANALHETARDFIKKGDYDNALLVLNRAITIEPDNKDLKKDLLYASYLKRDFAKAIEVGDLLIKRPDADVQTYQMLGLAYKAIADNKEAEKLYKGGLKKFANEGIIYSEYGELLAEKEPEAAMKLFERGIEADANHSTNYYHVAKWHAQQGEILWSIIYAETFLNLESFTSRSTEIKNLLLDEYKKFFLAGTKNASASKKPNEFLKEVAEVLSAQQNQAAYGITPESLTVIRTRFILQWYDKNAERFPFRLFDHQRQLLQEGLFDAYNQWLFGPASNLAAYQLWQKYHTEDYNNYLSFVRGRVYKIPGGQQYKSLN